jgi:hypothetical protein
MTMSKACTTLLPGDEPAREAVTSRRPSNAALCLVASGRSGLMSLNRGHISLDQLKVTGAIESCRTAALGGHVARCENEACSYTTIAYNSCGNRHCPKCQGAQAREWMEAREAELRALLPYRLHAAAGSPISPIRTRP